MGWSSAPTRIVYQPLPTQRPSKVDLRYSPALGPSGQRYGPNGLCPRAPDRVLRLPRDRPQYEEDAFQPVVCAANCTCTKAIPGPRQHDRQNRRETAGLIQLAAFLPAAFLVHKADGGVTTLWLAVGVWMAARLTTLGLRLRPYVARHGSGAAVRTGPYLMRQPGRRPRTAQGPVPRRGRDR